MMREIRKVDEVMYALIDIHDALNTCPNAPRQSILTTIEWVAGKCVEAIELLVELDPTLRDDENGYVRVKEK